jgi:hypothetical protein
MAFLLKVAVRQAQGSGKFHAVIHWCVVNRAAEWIWDILFRTKHLTIRVQNFHLPHDWELQKTMKDHFCNFTSKIQVQTARVSECWKNGSPWQLQHPRMTTRWATNNCKTMNTSNFPGLKKPDGLSLSSRMSILSWVNSHYFTSSAILLRYISTPSMPSLICKTNACTRMHAHTRTHTDTEVCKSNTRVDFFYSYYMLTAFIYYVTDVHK